MRSTKDGFEESQSTNGTNCKAKDSSRLMKYQNFIALCYLYFISVKLKNREFFL